MVQWVRTDQVAVPVHKCLQDDNQQMSVDCTLEMMWTTSCKNPRRRGRNDKLEDFHKTFEEVEVEVQEVVPVSVLRVNT